MSLGRRPGRDAERACHAGARGYARRTLGFTTGAKCPGYTKTRYDGGDAPSYTGPPPQPPPSIS